MLREQSQPSESMARSSCGDKPWGGRRWTHLIEGDGSPWCAAVMVLHSQAVVRRCRDPQDPDPHRLLPAAESMKYDRRHIISTGSRVRVTPLWC
eukprot:5207110-Prymnesium_polylepis.1